MKIVRFSKGDLVADGLVDGDEVHVIGSWRDRESGVFELSRMPKADIVSAAAHPTEILPLASVKLELPIDARSKIICIGANYLDHVGEFRDDPPAQPALFLRHIDSMVGPADPLCAPAASDSFDYEGEIAVVIGKAGRYIDPAEADSYILGYSCFFDGSVRAFQKHSVAAGKNFWRSGSMGPWIVTPDEAGDIANASLETRVDGEILQQTTGSLMIFGVPALIAYCSIWTQLNPGDVIATGTPGGVGAFQTPPRWLRRGETVEVAVSGVGLLRNEIR